MQVHPKTRFNLFQLDTISAQVMRVCQIGLLISLLLTLPLWLPFMTVFPQIPLFEALPEVPTSIQIYLFGIAVFSLLLGFFAPTQKWGLLSFMVCISASVFVDFLRIQPWLYYFTLFMGIILLAGKDEDKAHSLIAFALSCVYIFSGLQKFNAAFAADTYPWLIAPITQFLPDGLTNVLNKTWLLAPVTECAAGLGLWFPKTRSLSRWTLIGMHLFILAMIGPFGHNSNSVIWPWNVAFIVLLIVLFKPSSEFSISKLLGLTSRFLKPAVVLFFAVLPILSFWGAWPKHMSAALYSGNKVKSDIYLTDEIVKLLPEYVRSRVAEHDNKISTTTWAMKELNVALYPSKKVHLQVFKKVCLSFADERELLVLTLFEEPNILTGTRAERSYFCDDLIPQDQYD